MKCTHCGAELEGRFCMNCGAPAATESVSPQQPINQFQYQDSTSNAKPKKNKKPKVKKPFYKRGWFILLVIIVLIVVVKSIANANKGEKIDWSDIEIGEVLPTPDIKKGEINYNTDDELSVDFYKVSEKEYKDYLSKCKDIGFTIDSEQDSDSYEAYNDDGYNLSLCWYNDEMSIELEAPMKVTTIKWPTSTVGKLLPVPKSDKGKFSYEYEDEFFVYISNTSHEDYQNYVTACSEKGFNVDYDKSDNYYEAENAAGYILYLEYVGNNTMSIDISSPKKNKDKDIETTKESKKQESTTAKATKPTQKTKANGLSPDFKAAMDSYEKFMDEYVAFMKKYEQSGGTDLGLLTDYASYMSKYSQVCEDFEKWDDEELNDAELAYYIEVQLRVEKKLLDVIN